MRWWRAPVKVNLTLRVLGRRPDGLHLISSLVAFGEPCDWLGFTPWEALDLKVEGPTANQSGPSEKNLVLKAARALSHEIPNVKLGRFRLVKRLPAAAGIGGGSADAAAALRALADANGLQLSDPRLRVAALAAGADVPVCILSRARAVEGVGEALGPPLCLPPLFILLVNPGVAIPTRDVFEALKPNPASLSRTDHLSAAPATPDLSTLGSIAQNRNDLEPPAVERAPVVAELLKRLAKLPAAQFSRMSGSGSTCFAAFNSCEQAERARRTIAGEYPRWWVEATRLH